MNLSVIYHYVRDWNYPAFSKREFKQQVEFLLESRECVSVEQMLGGKTHNTFTLTFDDGLRDGFLNALPVIEGLGVKAAFFVPTRIFTEKKVLGAQKRHLLLERLGTEKFAELFNGLVDDVFKIRDEGVEANLDDSLTTNLKQVLDLLPERVLRLSLDRIFESHFDEEEEFDKMYFSLDDIREMKEAGMEFGVHGHDHCWMDRLPFDKMRKEIALSAGLFKEHFPEAKPIIAYPFGGYNLFTKRLLRQHGFVAGFTSKKQFNGRHSLRKPLELNRFDCVDIYPRKDKSLLEEKK